MCLNYIIVEPYYSGYHYYRISSEIVIAKVQRSFKLRLQCQKIAMVKADNNGLEWKYWKFHLIFWCGNFVKDTVSAEFRMNHLKLYGNCLFPHITIISFAEHNQVSFFSTYAPEKRLRFS